MKLKQRLKSLGACNEAIEWTEDNNITTLTEAWAKCERGDWMLWFAGKLSGEPEGAKRKVLVLAACECARLALPYAKSPTALACIETAEQWARGEATIEQVRESYNASYNAAACASYADCASYNAASCASYASCAAYNASCAAYDAASAADTAKRTEPLKQCADIARKHYPKTPRCPIQAF